MNPMTPTKSNPAGVAGGGSTATGGGVRRYNVVVVLASDYDLLAAENARLRDERADMKGDYTELATEAAQLRRDLATTRAQSRADLDNERAISTAAIADMHAGQDEIAALRSRVAQLEGALTKLVAEFDDMDEHRPLHAGCIQCTEGATPDRYNTGPCAYHTARAALSPPASTHAYPVGAQ